MTSLAPPPATRDGERAARLRDYDVLDPAVPFPALDEIVRRAREAGGFPVAWLSFLDGERELLRAASGLGFTPLAPEGALARHVAERGEPLYVHDTSVAAWRRHPFVHSGPRARFLAVIPLACADGLVVGALTVMDRVPRQPAAHERNALANLASLAVARLEARRESRSRDARAPLAERLEAETRRRQAAEAQLAREREFAEAVLDSLASAFFLVSPQGRMLRWNASLAAALGYPAAQIGAMHPADFVSPRDRPAVEAALREVMEQGREMTLEAEIVDRAGNVRPYAITAKPLQLAEGTCVVGVARDITMRKRAERQMARAKERLDLALSGSRLALWDWDLRNDKVYFNESWSSLLGGEPAESTCSGEEVAAWNHPDDREVFAAALGNAVKGVSEAFDCEYRVPNAAGDWIWVHSRGKVTQRDEAGRALRMTGTSTNVSERKQAEERAEWLASRDALTGLPNRLLLHDRLEQAIVNAARNQAGFAFMFIDLDRFKTINDSLGHQVGDELLKAVASRLTACVRATDTVARLGGDEFAVILENLRDDDEEGAQHVAGKMIGAMASPMLVDGQALSTSCSIGISVYPADGRDSAALMKNADVAMYYAKEKGRNNYRFFSAEMNARAQERLSLENYLRLALRRGELALHYQPRVAMASRALVAVEALLRWQHPRRGLLPPEKFIDVAEDSGLIVPIGEWVLEAACLQLAAWQRGVEPGLRLSVNVSAGQLADGERLYRAVERALERSGVAPSTLEIELTESHLMQGIEEKAQLLQRLGALGVSVSIDDFGTGYSSLSYLKRLPVDAIKIDGSFVRGLGAEGGDDVIVEAIVAMAHSLRLNVVAEGVENGAQLAALRRLGCDEYQGFVESPPLPPAGIDARYGRRAGR